MIKLPNISLYNTDWTVTEASTRGGTVPVVSALFFSAGIGGNFLSMMLKNKSGDTISLKGIGTGITGGIGISLPVVNASVSRKDISPKHPGIGNIAASNDNLHVDDLKGWITIYTASEGGAAMVGGSSVAFFTRLPFAAFSPISVVSDFLSLIMTRNLRAVGAFWGYSFQSTAVDVSSSMFVYKVTDIRKTEKREHRSLRHFRRTFGGAA